MSVNTKNLRRLIEGVYSGELEHNQEFYFCGTACCLAGWDFSLDRDLIFSNEAVREDTVVKEGLDVWNYSQVKNGLTYSEALLFFDSDCTKDIHYAALEYFEKGYRLGHRTSVFIYKSYDDSRVVVELSQKEPELEEILRKHDVIVFS